MVMLIKLLITLPLGYATDLHNALYRDELEQFLRCQIRFLNQMSFHANKCHIGYVRNESNRRLITTKVQRHLEL
jgi:hypothetical protein